MKIIAVCTGNTCRSPMAEAFLKDKLSDAAEVISRGLFVAGRMGAAENSISVMKEYGLDITGHISKQLTEKETLECELILTMTHSHKEQVISICPEARDKVFALCEYVGCDGDIKDPFGGSVDEYRQCAKAILQAVERIDV